MNYLDYHIIETTLDGGGKLRGTRWVSHVLTAMFLNRSAFTFHVIAKWQESVHSERAAEFRQRIRT